MACLSSCCYEQQSGCYKTGTTHKDVGWRLLVLCNSFLHAQCTLPCWDVHYPSMVNIMTGGLQIQEKEFSQSCIFQAKSWWNMTIKPCQLILLCSSPNLPNLTRFNQNHQDIIHIEFAETCDTESTLKWLEYWPYCSLVANHVNYPYFNQSGKLHSFLIWYRIKSSIRKIIQNVFGNYGWSCQTGENKHFWSTQF